METGGAGESLGNGDAGYWGKASPAEAELDAWLEGLVVDMAGEADLYSGAGETDGRSHSLTDGGLRGTADKRVPTLSTDGRSQSLTEGGLTGTEDKCTMDGPNVGHRDTATDMGTDSTGTCTGSALATGVRAPACKRSRGELTSAGDCQGGAGVSLGGSGPSVARGSRWIMAKRRREGEGGAGRTHKAVRRGVG